MLAAQMKETLYSITIRQMCFLIISPSLNISKSQYIVTEKSKRWTNLHDLITWTISKKE